MPPPELPPPQIRHQNPQGVNHILSKENYNLQKKTFLGPFVHKAMGPRPPPPPSPSSGTARGWGECEDSGGRKRIQRVSPRERV